MILNCQLSLKHLQAEGNVSSQILLYPVFFRGEQVITNPNPEFSIKSDHGAKHPTQHKGSWEVIKTNNKVFFLIPFHLKTQGFIILVPRWSRLVSQKIIFHPLQETHSCSVSLSQSFHPGFFLQLFTKKSA